MERLWKVVLHKYLCGTLPYPHLEKQSLSFDYVFKYVCYALQKYNNKHSSIELCLYVSMCVSVFKASLRVYVWFSNGNRRGGCWEISCRRFGPSAVGPEDRGRRRKEAHNKVPEAPCIGNTAGVQPGPLSYKSFNIQYLWILHSIQYIFNIHNVFLNSGRVHI